MEQTRFADRLEILGLLAGVFLVLAGLGTIAGLPWQTAVSLLVAVLKVIGGLLAIAIGAGLIWFTRTDESAV